MWQISWPKISSSRLTCLIIMLGIALRIYGITTPPQYYDMDTFQAWALHMLQVGPANFYQGTWSDYLPLPLYSIAPIALLSQHLGLPFGLIFKCIMSLTEIILILWLIKLSTKGKRWLVSAFFMLSPALIGDTAFWGQIDTIPALLTVLSFLLIPNSSFLLACILFGLAVAIKPIVVIVAPILWIVAVKHGQKWWQLPLISALVFFATGIPMAGLRSLQLLWSRTLEQAATYPYTTVNAWNFWSLVPVSHWPSDIQTVLGISGHTAGLAIFFALASILLRRWHQTQFDSRSVLRVAGTLLIIFFTFATRMHERHLLFGLPLLTLAVVYESWLLFPLVVLTTTFTLNLWGAYSWVTHAQVWPVTPVFISLVSWITTITALALATVWHWPSFLHSIIIKLKTHKSLALILLASAFLRLCNLAYPQTYIFDEVYHAFTAREYLHNHVEAWEWWTTPPGGVAYEWTHPGVAKYAMVAGMLLFGEDSFGWRIGSALAGVISIYGLYLFIHALMHRKDIALFASALLAMEGLHISQSRIAMNDIYMFAFFTWALYAAIRSRWKLASVLFGLAVGSKWSAIYGLLPLSIIYLHNNPVSLSLSSIVHNSLTIIRLLLIIVSVYTLTFTPFILAGHSWEQFIELHRQMWYYHTHLVATHAYQSTPIQWIFGARPVWYYVDYLPSVTRNIYAQANPLILWLGLVALILQVKKLLTFPYILLYTLYLVFTLPWVLSPRIMFFYHYLPSASFLCILLATWLCDLSPRLRTALLICTFLSLCAVSPMIYAIPVSTEHWEMLFKLFPSWK